MDFIWGLLDNNWIINIGSGAILLGIGYTGTAIVNRRGNKEYKQKVDRANSEILYSLRSSIAEGSMPTKNTIEAVARATSREYFLERESLLSLSEVADDLIREVMNSHFLSYSQKEEYIKKIIAVSQENQRRIIVEKEAKERYLANWRRRGRYLRFGFIASVTGVAILLYGITEIPWLKDLSFVVAIVGLLIQAISLVSQAWNIMNIKVK